MSSHQFIFKPQKQLDKKWLDVDIHIALYDPEKLSTLYNTLIHDREIIFDKVNELFNSAGVVSKLSENGKYYCGLKILTCTCCDGFCGPQSGCACPPCGELFNEEEARKKLESNNAVQVTSIQIIPDLKWNLNPDEQSLRKLLDVWAWEQRERALTLADNSPHITTMRKLAMVYNRTLLAFIRNESKERNNLIRNESNKIKNKKIEQPVETSAIKSDPISESIQGVAAAGARAALRLALSLARRAWRCGEDADVCSALLRDALDAVRALPPAALYPHSSGIGTPVHTSMRVWAEVVDSAATFLHQVVVGEVGCNVPIEDWRTSLCVWIELCSRRAELPGLLRAVLILLTLPPSPKQRPDSGVMLEEATAPLGPFLHRMISIKPSSKIQREDLATAPTEEYLKEVVIPDEDGLISVRKAGIILISLLDKLAAPLMPPLNGFQMCLGSTQEVYMLGSELLPLDSIRVQQICCGLVSMLLLSHDRQVYLVPYDTMDPVLVQAVEGKGIAYISVHPCGRQYACCGNGAAWTWSCSSVCGGICDNTCGLSCGGSVCGTRCNGACGATATRIVLQHDVVSVHVGQQCCAAISSRGVVFTWGKAPSGLLAQGTVDSCLTPQPVLFPGQNAERVVHFAFGCGDSQTLCCTWEGTVWSWGDPGSNGIPILVDGLVGIKVVKVYTFMKQHAVLSDRGQVYSWYAGESVGTPKLLEGLKDVIISEVSLSAVGGALLTSTGAVYMWTLNRPPIQAENVKTTSVPRGICCSSKNEVFIWSEETDRYLPTYLPFVIDLSDNTLMLLERLLKMAVDASASLCSASVKQENTCLAYACLNLLRLQASAMSCAGEITWSVSVRDSVVRAVCSLAGGTAGRAVSKAAGRALIAGAPVLLPPTEQRAVLLSRLLSTGCESISRGDQFMLELLIWSLLGGNGLIDALDYTLSSETGEQEFNVVTKNNQWVIALKSWQRKSKQLQNNFSGKIETFTTVPLMHLMKQLMKNITKQTQFRMCVKNFHEESVIDKNKGQLDLDNGDDDFRPGCDLLVKFQRLLMNRLQSGSRETCSAASRLLKYHLSALSTYVTLTLQSAYKSNNTSIVCSLLLNQLVGRVWCEMSTWLLAAGETAHAAIASNFKLILQSVKAAEKFIQRLRVNKLLVLRSCENRALLDILKKLRGKDVTKELSNPDYGIYLPKITRNFVGLYADSFETCGIDVSNTSSQIHYALDVCIHNLVMALITSGAYLSISLPIQTVEVQSRPWITAPFLRGGLQTWKPSNPFDEEKSDARSCSGSSTGGNSPDVPSNGQPITTSIVSKAIHNSLAEAKLNDRSAFCLWRACERGCGQTPNFPPDHPMEELRRSLLASLLYHTGLSQHARVIAMREMEEGEAKLSPALLEIAKIVQQTKWVIMKRRQQNASSYKEVCAVGTERARWVCNEIRAACAVKEVTFNGTYEMSPALKRLINLLKSIYKAEFKREMLNKQNELTRSKMKVIGSISKSESELLNRSVQARSALKTSEYRNKIPPVMQNLQSVDHLTKDQINQQLKMKTLEREMEVRILERRSKKIGLSEKELKNCGNNDKTSTNDISFSSINEITDNSLLKESIESENPLLEDDFKNDIMEADEEKDVDNSERTRFVNRWVSKVIDKDEDYYKILNKELTADQRNIVKSIVDFVMSENACDIDVLRRALYCQVQRAEIRKSGYEIINQVFQSTHTFSSQVKYSALIGAFGPTLDESPPTTHLRPVKPLTSPLCNIESVVPYSKFMVLQERSRLITYLGNELKELVLKNEFQEDGLGCTNRDKIRLINSNPQRARFIILLLTLLTDNFHDIEIQQLIYSGNLNIFQTVLRQAGGGNIQNSVLIGCNWEYASDALCIYEEERAGARTRKNSLSGPDLAAMMKIGTKVIRGKDWKWGDQDNGGAGRVASAPLDGWVRVRWDGGGTNSYRMGREGKYDLALAIPVSSARVTSPFLNEKPKEKWVKETYASLAWWVRVSAERALRAAWGGAGAAKWLSKEARRGVAGSLRAATPTHRPLHSTPLTLVRATCQNSEMKTMMCNEQFFDLCYEILSKNDYTITCELLYTQIETCRLIRSVWGGSYSTALWNGTMRSARRLVWLLGRLVLRPREQIVDSLTNIDNCERVTATASYSGTLAAWLAWLIRELMSSSHWHDAIQSLINERLQIVAQMVTRDWHFTLDNNKGRSIHSNQNDDTFLAVGALCVMSPPERRIRIGNTVKIGKGKSGSSRNAFAIVSGLRPPVSLLLLYPDCSRTLVDISNVEMTDLDGLPNGFRTNEAVLKCLISFLNAIPGQPDTDPLYIKRRVEHKNIKRIQLQLCSILALHSALLRRPARIRNFLISATERSDGCYENNLFRKMLTLSTRPSPMKDAHTFKELASAVYIVTQHLASKYTGEMKPKHPDGEVAVIGKNTLIISGASTSKGYSSEGYFNVEDTPQIQQVVDMGFPRRAVYAAIKALSSSLPTVEAIIAYLLERPYKHIGHDDNLMSHYKSDNEFALQKTHKPYRWRSCFASEEEYLRYFVEVAKVGLTVTCCKSTDEVALGDIGQVLEVDKDKPKNFTLLVEWRAAGSRSVPAACAEVVWGGSPYTVGDKVRVRAAVSRPRYNWGCVDHASIGRVTGVSSNGRDLTIDFPQQPNWTGQVSEIELVTDDHGVEGTTSSNGDIVDWREALRSLSVCCARPGAGAKRLLDARPHSAWHTASDTSSHWIRLSICSGVVIRRLSIGVICGERLAPDSIYVSVGFDQSQLKNVVSLPALPASTSTNNALTMIQLLADCDQHYPFIEIQIIQNNSTNSDCRVHGLYMTGYRPDLLYTDALKLMNFVADDWGEKDSAANNCNDSLTPSSPGDSPKVWVWGLNDKDQLGGVKGSKVKVPIYSNVISTLKPVQIAGGSKTLFIVTHHGKLYACGEGTNGRLGLGHSNNVSTPRLNSYLSHVYIRSVAVHSGGKHALALTADGKVWSWGEGEDGKLGHGNRQTLERPKRIEALCSKLITAVACGSAHSAALTECGRLYTWGLGEYGRLGHGDHTSYNTPKLVEALLEYKVIQVACGSRDAQTLALTTCGKVFSWGDGDFGKLGRGGSEGCSIPQNIEMLNNLSVTRVECGAQFSLALTKDGEIWTWGKGDYYRLGHGCDTHVRRPTLVEGLRGKRVINVAVGALHCLAVTDDQQIWSWGDNDHGQLGNGTTIVNRRPGLVSIRTAEGSTNCVSVTYVAAGSSHSAAWTILHNLPQSYPFPIITPQTDDDNVKLNEEDEPSDELSETQQISSGCALASRLLSLEPASISQHALDLLVLSLQIVHARWITVESLRGVVGNLTSANLTIDLDEDNAETQHEDNAKTESTLSIMSSSGSQSRSSLPATMSASAVCVAAATMPTPQSGLDEFTSQLTECDARTLLNLLKLSIAGRMPDTQDASKIITDVLLGICNSVSENGRRVRSMIIEECVRDLELAAKTLPNQTQRPVTVDSPHPYPDNANLMGKVRIPGARVLRVQFEPGCSTERRNDLLTISDNIGRTIGTRSGRDQIYWPDVLVMGDELVWRFTSDGSVNGWGWRFTVYSVQPANYTFECSSDRVAVLHGNLRVWCRLLTSHLITSASREMAIRLTSALISVARLPHIDSKMRVWCVRSVRRNTDTHAGICGEQLSTLPTILNEQRMKEDIETHSHSTYLKELAWLACSLKLDCQLCSSTASNNQQWMWFKRYCLAVRTASAIIERKPLPVQFVVEVRKRLLDMGMLHDGKDDLSVDKILPWEDNALFTKQHDEQLLHWVNKRPDDWSGWWGAGACSVLGWGHNHRNQLGGLDGAKIREPTHCAALSALRPAQLVGGEQTVFAVTHDGKLYATGFGAGGRLGIGGTDSVATPTLLSSIQHIFITKVASNSGGKHCLALSDNGDVYSWGEGEDGKLGHGNRLSYDRPKLITALCFLEVISIACGGAHSACITSRGRLYTWGKGRYGRLGHGDSEDQLLPKMVEALANYIVVDVACGSGDAQTLCITDDDNVWSWGDGDYGKLGRGGSEGCKLPMRIDCLKGLNVIKVECGSQFSVALCRDGSVYTWGKGDYHRLGHGSYDHVRRPMKVAGLHNKVVTSIATGSLHCVVCTQSGEVLAWGDNDEGQLGDGGSLAAARPRPVRLQGKRAHSVACGSAHTVALCLQPPPAPRIPPTPPVECHLLRDREDSHYRCRLVMLNHFSELICMNLPLISLEGVMDELRNLLFYCIKENAFKKAVSRSMSRDRQHGPAVELCRVASTRKRPVFCQMVQKMTVLTPSALTLPQRVWKVKFIGESVDDCGGGYSESIAEMCEELQNGSINILIETPDARAECTHDLFLLNPRATSTSHSNQFKFLGILMGIAIRTGSPLSLSLAECVWRQLAGLQLRPQDLADVDKDFLPALLSIRSMKSNSKEFQNLELLFSIPSAAGQDVPLSTRHKKVTLENKDEYVQLALHYRLNEFSRQAAWVREGICRVVPGSLLSLFTPLELEALVCGSPDIPVQALRASATYKGVDPTAPLVQWLWEVVEELSAAERALLLRFVWGRTRLPRAPHRQRDFVLQVLDKYQPPDHYLPESYTCFFLLKMPRYSSKAILREKLRYAIHFCKSIDTDEYARVALTAAVERASSSDDDEDSIRR